MNQGTENFIVRAFEEGGSTMYIIALIGLMAIVVVVQQVLKMMGSTVNKREFNENIFGMVVRGDLRGAIAYCDSRPSALTSTVKAGLVQAVNRRPDEEVQVAMDAAVLREMPKIEGWSSFLAVFGNVAVLAGLFGTIIGMIKSFRSLADADNATKAVELSKGISHALNCTAFGLIVAIICIVFYAFFQLRISRIENEVMETSMQMLNLVAANRDKMKE